MVSRPSAAWRAAIKISSPCPREREISLASYSILGFKAIGYFSRHRKKSRTVILLKW